MYFQYGETEIEYLKKKDTVLADAIDKIGMIQRPVMPDLFCAIVYNIIGQQISTAALNTIWNRLKGMLPEVNASTVLSLSKEKLQSIGITYRKAEYILNFAGKVNSGDYRLEKLFDMTDEEAIESLISLNGIGQWTAEMILIFSMQRPDVVSFGDLAIQRGMRMLYHHREIDRKKFERYKRRYSPYGTVASLYLWAIAGGAIDGMKDYQKSERL
ncbi:MAG: DNA-3-methyladenine glycosylase 2 family protein [Lachnospiraceae bacterium]|nr:DNA-3-methyladenine glycosylase 2 family protein [Lachnospiraceae bacterium]